VLRNHECEWNDAVKNLCSFVIGTQPITFPGTIMLFYMMVLIQIHARIPCPVHDCICSLSLSNFLRTAIFLFEMDAELRADWYNGRGFGMTFCDIRFIFVNMASLKMDCVFVWGIKTNGFNEWMNAGIQGGKRPQQGEDKRQNSALLQPDISVVTGLILGGSDS